MSRKTHVLKQASMTLCMVLLMLCTVVFISPDSMLRADTKDGEIVNVTTTVNVRKEPTTKSDIVTTLTNGTKIKVEDTVNAKSGDTSGSAKWCKISVTVNNKNYTGYVAETYVKISVTTTPTTPTPTTTSTTPTSTPSADKNFEDQIKDFPDSYKKSLRDLHEKHPKWKFVAQTCNSDWNEVLNLESRNGVSLVENTVDNAWKSKASDVYDPATNTFKVIDSPNWVNASRGLIAYYLDPRNNLNDDGVFQFLDLDYSKAAIPNNPDQYVTKVLQGSFMANTMGTYAKSSIEYSKLFAIAGYESSINPIFLAARSIQEVGINGSTSSKGANGYYNFYNIGAYSDATNSAYVGLKFAQYGNGVANSEFNQKYLIPWDSQGNSIIGGAKWMSDYYTSRGQNTIYYMRFNTSPKSGTKLCSHQYMTATQSATSEAKRMFTAYDKAGIVNSELTFIIPVYKNMPSEACPLPTKENAAYDLINRSYQLALGRAPKSDELTSMSTRLVNGEEATKVIASIFESQEFNNRKLSVEDQVKIMYQVLLGRDADEDGLKYYKDLMNKGYSILYPYQIVSGSQECRKFFDLYSVNSGSYTDTDKVDKSMNTLKPFVERLYTGFMGREYDRDGLRFWMNALVTNTQSGQQVAEAFYNSPEFQGLKLSDEEFVKRLYTVCLGREADDDGLKYWLGQIENEHYSRTHILEGFLNSKEFNSLCDQYKVSKSKYTSSTTYTLTFNEEKVKSFVTRLYQLSLSRDPDPDGFDFWVNELKKGSDGKTVSKGFIFSPELSDKKLSDEDYVEVLYKIFLDRASESEGKAFWVKQLKNGSTREQVFDGFCGSEEFKKLCLDAGIKPNDTFQL
ncbi:MAG: DUF4214 domain-containing protein [Clostridiales bacterium]|nr:DUF4214 domain-containing protein [Clostridiales bacterium]